MIQLVALDLDGTLIDDDMGKSSARVCQAISAAQARGVVVTLQVQNLSVCHFQYFGYQSDLYGLTVQ